MSSATTSVRLATFVIDLGATAVPPHCHNPYTPETPRGEMRQHNLRLYLQEMAAHAPQWLLVGEAPGYRGCRLTGIPFVSPAILADAAAVGLGERPYQLPDAWPQLPREASATLMWQQLQTLPATPLLWNIFPFHPHQPHKPRSNRAPTRAEIRLGLPILQRLIDLFESPRLIAVGKKAAFGLAELDLPHHTVRHPSQGGKQAFAAGLHRLIPSA